MPSNVGQAGIGTNSVVARFDFIEHVLFAGPADFENGSPSQVKSVRIFTARSAFETVDHVLVARWADTENGPRIEKSLSSLGYALGSCVVAAMLAGCGAAWLKQSRSLTSWYRPHSDSNASPSSIEYPSIHGFLTFALNG